MRAARLTAGPIAVALLHLAGVDAHTDFDQWMLRERGLCLGGGVDGVGRSRKGSREAIAASRENVSAVGFDSSPNDRIVLGERGAHRVGPLLP